MNKFTIAHDMPGRLRVRFGKYAFDADIAHRMTAFISTWSSVRNVEISAVTGSVLLHYEGNQRDALLNALQRLDFQQLPASGNTPAINGQHKLSSITEEYQHRFLKMTARRYLMRWFLPSPLAHAILMVRFLRYLRAGAASLFDRRVDVAVLDAASIGASLLQRNWKTAGNIMFLLQISELLEDYTHKKTKLQLSESLTQEVDQVWLYEDGNLRKIPMLQLRHGDVIVMHMGNMIPVDGEVVSGEAMINEASFTGEPLSKRAASGDTVFAGTLVEEGSIHIRVRNLNKESRIASIVQLIDTNESLKAGIQARAEHLADAIVPFSFLGFFTVFAFTRNLTRAISLLMVDYSCAIRLSTSIAIISAMREASLKHVIVKGGKYFEAVKDVDVVVFDKTGTLTNARPQVKTVLPLNGYSREEVLKIAACLEEHFPHSVANAIVHQAVIEELQHREEHAEVKYIIAHGIATTLHGRHTVIGSDHFVFEDEGVECSEEVRESIRRLECEGAGSMIYLAIGRQLAGIISIYDPLKEEAAQVVADLRAQGIKKVIMLTGDCRNAAEAIAQQLQLDDYRYGILPQEKAAYIEHLKKSGHVVMMVGDGINETPALSAADVSVSMQDSSDLARELADVTLLSSSLKELIELRRLSGKLFDRIHENYSAIVGFNSLLLALGAFGIMTPGTSSLFHNAGTFLISASSTRKLLS